jgi:hypothetical protein
VRNERGARVARGSAIAAFATFTASLAHTLGGGLPPGLLTIALALAFSVPFAIAMVGRRAGITRSAIAAIGSQLALHALYSLGPAGAPASVTMTDASAAAGAHAHATHVHIEQTYTTLATDAAAAHTTHQPLWMLLAHAAAAALTIVFIACADRVLAAIRSAARGVRLAWAILTTPVAPPRPTRTRRPEASVPRLARDLHLLSLRRRGPPMAVAVA